MELSEKIVTLRLRLKLTQCLDLAILPGSRQHFKTGVLSGGAKIKMGAEVGCRGK